MLSFSQEVISTGALENYIYVRGIAQEDPDVNAVSGYEFTSLGNIDDKYNVLAILVKFTRSYNDPIKVKKNQNGWQVSLFIY